MFFHILRDSLVRRRWRVAIAVFAVVMGASITSSLLMVSFDITERVGRELKAFGANIVVTPVSDTIPVEVGGVTYATLEEERYLDEGELPKLKTIFWRHQVVAFAPYLFGQVETRRGGVVLAGTWFDKEIAIPGARVTLPNGTVVERSGGRLRTGVRELAPWWKVVGSWPSDEAGDQVLVGASLARRLSLGLGDTLRVSYRGLSHELTVVGLVSTGGFEEDQAFVALDTAQRILRKPEAVQRVLVSALIKPDDELARKDHGRMTPEEHVTWYCSPYIGVFVYQIEEALPEARAKPIRQVAETEGRLLEQNQLLFTLIAISSVGASAVAVFGTMTASVLQRRREIGLMKAIGADSLQIAALFIAEAGLIGLIGGLLGLPLGYLLASIISSSAFSAPVTSVSPAVLPITVVIAVGISLAGSAAPVRKAVGLEAAAVLRGE